MLQRQTISAITLKAVASTITESVMILINTNLVKFLENSCANTNVSDTSQPSNCRPITLLLEAIGEALYKHILKHSKLTVPVVLQQ